MRLRQFVFVAEGLKAAVVDIGATLGLPVCFNDPNVGRFGLQNALLPIGGDGGYMIILQCDDAVAQRERIAELEVRTSGAMTAMTATPPIFTPPMCPAPFCPSTTWPPMAIIGKNVSLEMSRAQLAGLCAGKFHQGPDGRGNPGG